MKQPSPQIFPRHTPTLEEISFRAFEIWQSRGCPEGRDRENWFEAERELSDRGTYEDARDPSPSAITTTGNDATQSKVEIRGLEDSQVKQRSP